MYKIYQVEMGETLESIANKLNTTVDNLKEINGILQDVSLMPGSFLIVPMVDDRFITYTVKQGDNIYSISKNYNVDKDVVLKLNGLNENDYIYPNQQIIIPNDNYNYYITKQGDTISNIAQRTNKSIMDILGQNENIYLEEDQLIMFK